MTLEDIDLLFTKELQLVTDPNERGHGRTYFWKTAIWAPSTTTRVARILFGQSGTVMAVQLCVSSDNNNSVLMRAPLDRGTLHTRVLEEIASLQARKSMA